MVITYAISKFGTAVLCVQAITGNVVTPGHVHLQLNRIELNDFWELKCVSPDALYNEVLKYEDLPTVWQDKVDDMEYIYRRLSDD